MRKMLYMACILILLAGCSIRTPEIHGVVLDAETKQPVENAWIGASLELTTKTGGGNAHSALSLDKPHTRTDKQGRFVIPSKNINKPSFPFGFGTEVLAFGVGASTVDDKGGGVKYFGGYYRRDFGKGDGELSDILKKRKADLTIYIKHTERNESEYFHHLQSLYNYCITGRFSVEVPAVKEGCDAWELDYVIKKHERYLERYSDILEKRGYSTALDQLADLYERDSDFEMAIAIFQKSIDLMKKRGLLKFEVWQKNKAGIEHRINMLQQKRQERQN